MKNLIISIFVILAMGTVVLGITAFQNSFFQEEANDLVEKVAVFEKKEGVMPAISISTKEQYIVKEETINIDVKIHNDGNLNAYDFDS